MQPILSLERITKHYPGVVALDNVDLEVQAGEVRALLGKNGAGKSTLVKVLSGAVRPDSGTIRVEGQVVSIHHPADAFRQGICTVYQEMSLVPGLTVAENITLGRWPKLRRAGIEIIDRSQIQHIARAALDQLQVHLNLNDTVGQLSVAHQQLVEIAKAISFNPRVLVLDEPTSALASDEVNTLHQVVRRLGEQGHAIIYVTHRLQEIPRVADSVTVLRDGRNQGTIPVSEATPERIARMMIGADWQRRACVRSEAAGDVRLSVRGLRRNGLLKDVSFDLRGGEILGLAGLMGSGRTELVRSIFGLDPLDGGDVHVRGRRVTHPSPIVMKSLGVGTTPEDRKRQGLVLVASVKHNLTMASLNRFSHGGVLSPRGEQQLAERMVTQLDIKTAGLEVEARTLSGGNQQKVVVGNWLNTEPDVLIMDEPTRGIDIQAKEQMFDLMRDLACQGMAILFISSEIEEVLDVADRILVINRGRITHEVNPDATTLERLMALVMEEIEDDDNHIE
jgi:ribose transport system ATP-binding protein